VLFTPLTLAEIERIVDLQIGDVRRRLADRHLTLELTDEARAFIAREGYDAVYGARPLKRFIQREVETRIGRALLAGDVRDGATISLDVWNDELSIRWENPGAEEAADREVVEASA